MPYVQSIRETNGCQKGLKKCNNVVKQMRETLVSFSQENITEKMTCVRRGEKEKEEKESNLLKKNFRVERETSNFCGHKGNKYLGMR